MMARRKTPSRRASVGSPGVLLGPNIAIRMMLERVFTEGKWGVFPKHYMKEDMETSDKKMDDQPDNSGEISSEKDIDAKGKVALPC